MKVSVDLDVKLDMFTCGTLSKDDKSSTLSLLCGALVNMYKVSSPCAHTIYIWVVPEIEPTILALQAPHSTNWPSEDHSIMCTMKYLTPVLKRSCPIDKLLCLSKSLKRSQMNIKTPETEHSWLTVFWKGTPPAPFYNLKCSEHWRSTMFKHGLCVLYLSES